MFVEILIICSSNSDNTVFHGHKKYYFQVILTTSDFKITLMQTAASPELIDEIN